MTDNSQKRCRCGSCACSAGRTAETEDLILVTSPNVPDDDRTDQMVAVNGVGPYRLLRQGQTHGLVEVGGKNMSLPMDWLMPWDSINNSALAADK